MAEGLDCLAHWCYDNFNCDVHAAWRKLCLPTHLSEADAKAPTQARLIKNDVLRALQIIGVGSGSANAKREREGVFIRLCDGNHGSSVLGVADFHRVMTQRVKQTQAQKNQGRENKSKFRTSDINRPAMRALNHGRRMSAPARYTPRHPTSVCDTHGDPCMDAKESRQPSKEVSEAPTMTCTDHEVPSGDDAQESREPTADGAETPQTPRAAHEEPEKARARANEMPESQHLDHDALLGHAEESREPTKEAPVTQHAEEAHEQLPMDAESRASTKEMPRTQDEVDTRLFSLLSVSENVHLDAAMTTLMEPAQGRSTQRRQNGSPRAVSADALESRVVLDSMKIAGTCNLGRDLSGELPPLSPQLETTDGMVWCGVMLEDAFSSLGHLEAVILERKREVVASEAAEHDATAFRHMEETMRQLEYRVKQLEDENYRLVNEMKQETFDKCPVSTPPLKTLVDLLEGKGHLSGWCEV
eukprot:GEMP01038788.1.p1 GENE.GEMP01038788.1~~GEMP01038788.1.p1  ORF type:complete len:473 (+),score=140.44 GEMP01038788.1:50-1468(+)